MMATDAEIARSTREQILRAAEDVIGEVGMRGATTRAIAHRAGCAEGSIYRYFADKHALFMEIAKRGSPSFLVLAAALPDRAGTRTVEENLRELAEAALEFHRAVIPMSCGIMAEHELLEQQRRHFRETRSGPLKAVGELEEYIRREQAIRRVSAHASAPHAARLLLETCFGQAFLTEMVGPQAQSESDSQFARTIVGLVMTGIAPARSRATAKPRNA
jgi:AcrR family transcriptional regulator